MISFYDWAPQSLVGTASGNSSCRSQAIAAPRSAEDEAARSDPEVQSLLCQKIQDAVDISDVFNKVALHQARAHPKTLAYAVHRIARYCRLRRADTGPTKRAARWTSLLREVQNGLPDLEPQSLTDIVWSLAVLSHRETKLLAAICHQAFGRVEEFTPANLAITAWSFATLMYRDDLMMKRLNRQALGRLSEFEAQSLSNIAWALATLRFKDDVLMHHVAQEALKKAAKFSPQHVANIAWAFATLGRRAQQLFDVLEERAVELLADVKADFVPLDLALCAWSFAWLEHAGPASLLLRSIAPVAVRRLEEFSTQQVANMLWGFDHANFVDSDFYFAIGKWCCDKHVGRSDYWTKAAGEELVSVMTALRPHAHRMIAERGEAWLGWLEVEHFFLNGTVHPLAAILRNPDTGDGYSQGLRKLRTYHAGALYTGTLLEDLGIAYLGDAEAPRCRPKVKDLVDFYMRPPEPRWLPDGYDDDDEQACRAEIPSLLELLEVKRRVQPSSHFIALHLSAELRLEADSDDACGEDGPRVASRSIWRAVPTRPPRRSGLCFVRGEKFDEHDCSGDEDGTLKTSTLRDYKRSHHAEVTALTQVTEVVADMDLELTSTSTCSMSAPAAARVTGWVELFVPHYPCISCTGALVQFKKRYPLLAVRVGHDDWRHWLRRLDERWDRSDTRHHQLSINARQLRDLDNELGDGGAAIPEAYKNALRGSIGGCSVGVTAAQVRTEEAVSSVSSAATLGGAAAVGAAVAAVVGSSEGTIGSKVFALARRQSFY